jgi:hypothetical protein
LQRRESASVLYDAEHGVKMGKPSEPEEGPFKEDGRYAASIDEIGLSE